MINLGISSKEQKRFNGALTGYRRIKVSVQFLDHEHRYISTVTNRLMDGQINIDASALVTRSATLSLLDPDHVIGLDSNSPVDGQAYLDRMVRIIYSVWVDDDWVDVPVFTGPITRVERTEDIIELEAQGKEHLAKRPAYKTVTWRSGLLRIDVVRAVMRDLAGERRFLLPDWINKTSSPVVIDPKKEPWNYARDLVKAWKAQIFYDGRGYLRVRHRPTRVSWTFRDGDGGSLLTVPDISYASEDIINTVIVTGAVPKGSKKRVSAKAFIPKAHPLSPHSLGRHGVSRYLPEYIEDDTIKSVKEAQETADRRIRELTTEMAEVTFDSLVIPHLEENDLVQVIYKGVAVTFRLRQMTIALSHNGVSSVGYLKRVSRNTKRIRRK